MTMHEGSPSDTTGSSSTPSTGDLARAAAGKAPEVAGDVAGHATDVASQAADQAKVVAGQAKDHVVGLLGQARSELVDQADGRSRQAAAGLQSLSSQLAALRDGRPADAGMLGTYIGEVEHRVSGLAERLHNGGAQGAIDDLTGFARRRPGLFLAGAVGLGFLAGRVARSGAAVAKEQHHTANTGTYRPSAAASTTPVLDTPPPTPLLDTPVVDAPPDPLLDTPLGDPLLAAPTVVHDGIDVRLDAAP